MQEEGYIKFNSIWEKAPLEEFVQFPEIDTVRKKLFALKLIGALPDGTGYGNISARKDHTGAFYITGTQTGGSSELSPQDYTLVQEAHIPSNTVKCRGIRNASSESMTHAAIYMAGEAIRAVIHVHHHGLWEYLLQNSPTTPADVPYGTAAMAYAVADALAQCAEYGKNIIAMHGHEDGLIFFGKDMEAAWQEVEQALRELNPEK